MFVLFWSVTLLLEFHAISCVWNGVRNNEWLKYSELQSLGASCHPGDTCTVPRNIENLEMQTCECKRSCTRYKTCCIDSPYRDTRPSFISKETCNPAHGAYLDIFMINKCNPNWKGDPMIIDNCESDKKNMRDPLATAPVTNPKTSTTYKNYFCAMCNNDEQDSKLWTFSLFKQINSTYEDVMGELVYYEERDSWGIWETDRNGEKYFDYQDILYRIPESMTSIVKICRLDLKTDCAHDWKDEQIRKKCESYMAAVYVVNDTERRQIGYQNPHCAICNHVLNFTNVCKIVYPPYGSKPSLSFSLLIDVNRSDGDKVGEVSNCPITEVYDPFFKKCRALVCALPGYVIRNRKCTRM